MKTNLTSSLASALVVAGIISQSVLPASAQIAYPATPTGETERGVIGDYVYQLRQQAYPNTANGVLEIGTLNNTKVGIGTNAPATQLELSSNGTDLAAVMFDSNGTNIGYIGDAAASDNDLYFTTYDSNALRFITDANTSVSPDMIIDANGNVGIGTSAPNAKLNITNGGLTFGNLTLPAFHSISSDRIDITATNSHIDMFDSDDTDSSFSRIERNSKQTSIVTNDGTSSTVRFSVLDNGNIGIGTTAPSTGGDQDLKLDVEGAIGGTHICDEDGNNCTTPASISALASGAAPKFVDGDDTSDAVYTAGNVGIGVTAPTSNLHIRGSEGIVLDHNFSDAASIKVVDEITEGTNSKDDLLIGAAGSVLVKLDTNSNGSGNPGGFNVYDKSNNNLFKIAETNGNVGIGTTAPSEKLHVSGFIQAGDTTERGLIRTYAPDSTNAQGHLYMHRGAGPTMIIGSIGDGSGATDSVYISKQNGSVGFLVDSDGNVGIDTLTPSTGGDQDLKLDVEGAIGGTHFCDEDGNNCTTAAGIAAAAAGGGKFVDGTDTADAVYTAGNVGIGTSAPTTELEVHGESRLMTLRDSGTDPVVAMPFIAFEDTTGTRLGYVGDGSSIRDTMTLNSDTGDVELRTAAGASLTAKPNGNVGIGTTAPSEKLEVAGNTIMRSSGIAAGQDLGSLQFGNTGNSTINASIGVIRGQNNFGEGNLILSTSPDDTGVLERMRITEDGNVGIGTTTPDSALDVHGDGTSGPVVHIRNNAATSPTIITFGQDPSSDWASIGQVDGNLALSAGYNAATNPHMTITNPGNVGIGTTSPGTKLEVNGTVKIIGNQVSQYQNVASYNDGSNGDSQYTHIRLPHNDGSSSTTQWGSYRIDVEGYNYGGSATGKIIDFTCVGYLYAATTDIINEQCAEAYASGHNPVAYKGSDGHVYIRYQTTGTNYHNNFTVDYKEVNPGKVSITEGDITIIKSPSANL